MPEPEFRISDYKDLALGSIYVLDAFRAAELLAGKPVVLSSGDLAKWIRHTSKRAAETLDNTRDQSEQIRTWATGAAEDLVISRMTVGGGRAVGGGGRQSDYALTDRAWRLILDAAESGR